MPDHKNPKLEPSKGSKDPKHSKGSQNKRSAIVSVILTVLILCALGYMLMGRSVTGADQTDTLETSQFTAAVNQGRVTEVSYTPGQYAVSGKYYPAVTAGSQAAAAFNDAFSALNTQLSSKHSAPASVNTTALDSQFLGDQRNFTSTSAGTSIEALMQQHPEIQYNVQVENSMWGILASAIPMLILCGLMIFFFWQMGKANNSQMSFGKARAKKTNEERPDVRFSDVAGCDEAVEEMKEIRDYLANPTKYQAIGAKVPHGCLLVGPPGTGKTLLAKAVAGEANVPFFSISGSDFVEMFVGVGASRVRDLFQQAKEAAPSIIFIDEIDAVGRQRGTGLGGGHDEREQTLNQLLVEMDGFDANTSVVLIAATNRADVLDPALLRPGRFDRQIVVDAPDVRGREKILKVHARNKPIAKDVDLSAIAKLTPGFTGADLANLLNEAALLTARRNKTVISMDEVQESMERVIAGPERRGRIMDEQTRKTIAYHESGHALVGHLLPLADPVHKITIVSRGRALGYTMSIPKEDKVMNGLHEMQQELAVYLGGRVSEEIFCDDITTGASNDLEQATKMARAMVTQYGMSSDLGVQIFGQPNHEPYLGRDYGNTQDYSDETARRIDDEVARIMRQAHDTAYKILAEHKDQMHLMASVLLERETVDGAACQALLDNKWDEYLAQESSEEGRKAREEAATTVVNQDELPGGDEHDGASDVSNASAAAKPEEQAATPSASAPQTGDATAVPLAPGSSENPSQADSADASGSTEK
jgi:cell division protease FtsH